MPSTQPTIAASRAALIPIAAVRATWSLSYEKIRALVVGGELFHPGFQWVWNFAARPDGERDLRFWRDEVDDVRAVSKLGLGEVIARILPLNRKNFHAGEVAELFMLTPTGLMRLRGQMGGRLETSGSFFTRDGLEHWLRTRWIGVHIPTPNSELRTPNSDFCPVRNQTNSAKVNGPDLGPRTAKDNRRAVNPSPRENARRAEAAKTHNGATREASDSNLAGFGTSLSPS